MKQIIIIGLFILGISLVESSQVNFDCVLTECVEELDECLKSGECKQQYDLMNQCYNKSSSECFSKSFSNDRLIEQDCMEECLNQCKIQTMEGSNVITCQMDNCLNSPNWDFFGIFKGQQNRAYFVAWFTFFAIITTLALIVKFITRSE